MIVKTVQANEPQFVMSASARKYAIELQEMMQIEYRSARFIADDYLHDLHGMYYGDDDSRQITLARQRIAAKIYARFVEVMGFTD